MKKFFLLVVLACATFATPCMGQKSKIVEGDPRTIDTLSYCLGAAIAMEIRNEKEWALFNFDAESLASGFCDVLVKKPSLSVETAANTLEYFFSETIAPRLVEFEIAFAADTTAVFKPYAHEAERKKISYTMGVVMGSEIRSEIDKEDVTIHTIWFHQGIVDAYTDNLKISTADMTAFIDRYDAKQAAAASAQSSQQAEKPVAEIAVEAPGLDSLSYSLGVNIAVGMKEQMGSYDINYTEMQKGVKDGFDKRVGTTSEEVVSELKQFFAVVVGERQTEYEKRKEQDPNAVFTPFVNDEERNRISYFLGVDVGINIYNSNLPIDIDCLVKAFDDACNDKLILSQEVVQNYLQHYFTVVVPAQAEENSNKWLAEKANCEGVNRTESGLLYKIVEPGDMARAAKSDADVVKVHYVGRLRDGRVFDSSRFEYRSKEQQEKIRESNPSLFDDNGKYKGVDEPVEFPLDKVIKGWTEGMKLVGPGGKIILYIPAELAYGARGAGSEIGPNEALEFEVELLEVTPATPATPAEVPAEAPAEEPFIKVEKMPSFQGGDLITFRNWVMSQIRYPKIAQEKNISGRVMASFVIERNGTVSNIQIIQSPHASLSDEVVRVLKTSPKWEPGIQDGEAVRVRYTLPVEFRVQN
jgi:FKBP-type peptidyl-prolyl cis-trans isomerase FkpA